MGDGNKCAHNQQVAGINKKLLLISPLFHESVVKAIKKQDYNDDKETGNNK